MSGFDAGEGYWFEERAATGRNPEIVLRPGATVWADFRNRGGELHNLHFGGPVAESTELAPAGHSLALRFVVPDEEGVYEYWCDPHRELGMRGQYRIQAEGDVAAGIPAVSLAALLLLAVVVALLAARGRRP